MAEDTKPAAPTAEERKAGIQAFYDSKSAEEKAAALVKYPWLKEVFSESSFS